MTLFTQKERMIFRFLVIAVAVGSVSGIIRKKYFEPNFSESINVQKEAFKDKSEEVARSRSINTKSDTKTGENIVENSVKLLDINAAIKSDLMTLPKIGPVTAERIIRYRDDFGPFKTVEDLLKVKGIGTKTLEKLKPFIQIN